MLLTVKEKVYAALSTNAEIVALAVGGIYYGQSPDAGTYPLIVYQEISNVPALSADNLEQISRITITVDVLTQKTSTYPLSKKIDEVMLDLGFIRSFSSCFVQDDLNIQTVRYVIAETE